MIFRFAYRLTILTFGLALLTYSGAKAQTNPFDPGKHTIAADSGDKVPVKFHADYVLSASKDGKSTDIKYVSVSADPTKALGIEVPEFMRRSIGIETFMRNLTDAGKYIQGVKE